MARYWKWVSSRRPSILRKAGRIGAAFMANKLGVLDDRATHLSN